MKKLIFSLTVILAMLCANTAFADVIYHNSFNYGVGDFEVSGNSSEYGGISIIPSESVYAMRLSTGMTDGIGKRNIMAVNKTKTGDSFTLELDFRLKQYDTENAGILFCVSENMKEYYALSIKKGTIPSFHTVPDQPAFTLGKNSIDNKITGSGDYKTPALPVAGWEMYPRYSSLRHLKIVYNKGTIDVYLDEIKEPVLTCEDAEPLKGGLIGVIVDGECNSDSGIDIDNVKVYEGISDQYNFDTLNAAVFMAKAQGAVINGVWTDMNEKGGPSRCVASEEGSTLIPAKFFAKVLKAEYSDSKTDAVLLKDGKTLAFLNGVCAENENQKAYFIDGEWYVPLRFVAEYFGKIVSWDDSGIITVADYWSELNNKAEYLKAFGKVLK